MFNEAAQVVLDGFVLAAFEAFAIEFGCGFDYLVENLFDV